MSKKKIECFVITNILSVIGHFISFTSMISLLLINGSVNFPLTENYLNYKVKLNQTLCPFGSREFNTNNGDFCIIPTNEPVYCHNDECYGLDLGILIVSFHILSFLFQISAGLTDLCKKPICGYKYSQIILTNKNPLRFIEYSSSASIMLVCISLLNGITDLDLIVCISVLTAMCQIMGLVVELVEDLKVKLILHLCGWVQFITAYAIIFRAFFNSIIKSNSTNPPEFVYVIVFSLFMLYGCFGFVQLSELILELKCFDKIQTNKIISKIRINGKINPKLKEITYVILSLTAKLLLGWLIFSNILIL